MQVSKICNQPGVVVSRSRVFSVRRVLGRLVAIAERALKLQTRDPNAYFLIISSYQDFGDHSAALRWALQLAEHSVSIGYNKDMRYKGRRGIHDEIGDHSVQYIEHKSRGHTMNSIWVRIPVVAEVLLLFWCLSSIASPLEMIASFPGHTPLETATISTPSGTSQREGILPEFSWDTVPVYIHVGKNSGFTDKEVEFVASHSDFVCLEKGHGMSLHGSTEIGIEYDAARLKKINPKMKVIYYWNTFLDYEMYEAHIVYENHPEWWLRTIDGSLDKKQGRLKRYDLSNAQVREWWTDEVRMAVVEGSCDGVFMDAFPQINSRANIRLWGKEKFDAIQNGLIETIELTREKIGSNNIIMFNGIRNTNSLHFGMQYFNIADAAKIEHFDQFESRAPENVALDIENMITAGKKGKIVIMKGWPGFNWLDRKIKNVPYEELVEEARSNITFPLACFLVAAQPYSYFCYSWGYREQHGSLSDYPEFSKPLGPPKGEAINNGWIYTRSFENVDVWVDVSKKKARLAWK